MFNSKIRWQRRVSDEQIHFNLHPPQVVRADFDTEPPLSVPGTCLTDKEIAEYLGNGKTGYGLHISDLVIYDEPKQLREFKASRTKHVTEKAFFQEGICDEIRHVRVLEPLSRPPQSWCYVIESFDNMIGESRQEADNGHD